MIKAGILILGKNYIEYEDSEEYHQKRKNIRLKMKKDFKD